MTRIQRNMYVALGYDFDAVRFPSNWRSEDEQSLQSKLRWQKINKYK